MNRDKFTIEPTGDLCATFYVYRNGVPVGAACNSYREAQKMLDYWRHQDFTSDNGEAVFRTV